MISFSDYRFVLERQPLSRPFHFKGGHFTEKWINVVQLDIDAQTDLPAIRGESTRPRSTVTAVGGNAVLWSDAAVFSDWSETGGNLLMSLLAERAVQIARGARFSDPIDAFHSVRPEVHEYARRISRRPDITPTFTLNAMVALDLAMWKAHSIVAGSERFLDLLPDRYRAAFGEAQEAVLRVPLVSYNVPLPEVAELVRGGHRVLKIKLGQGTRPDEMVELDSRRMEQIAGLVRSESAPVSYYLDANGRYRDLPTVQRLLDRMDRIGILQDIVILEEPFGCDRKTAVHQLPVRVAADESLHDVADLSERIDLGYRALALKPAGKTLSLSVMMAAKAAELGVPCFVADSACVPALLQWNLAFAAVLAPFPGIALGMLESNGEQNYANWNALLSEHGAEAERWMRPENGAFGISGGFHKVSGGAFRDTGHYRVLAAASD